MENRILFGAMVFIICFLVGIPPQFVKAAAANSQSEKIVKQPLAVNNTKTGKPENKSVSVSGQINTQDHIDKGQEVETSRDGSMQSENENTSVSAGASAKKKLKKKDSGDDEKSEELIEFNDQKGILAGLDYPELQVVPRASERLAFEAQDEKTRIISPYWPVQMSAITLIAAGFMSRGKYKNDSSDPTKNASQKNENAFASQLSILTGGLWLGTSYYMSHYLSYGEALQEIKKINGKDKKNTLLRERLAEEALERPARITYLINTLSVWSTLFSSIYTATHTTQVSPSYVGIAAAMAFMPWLIDSRIIRNWEKHQEYKRKIYAPLTMGSWDYDLTTRQWRPLLTLNWVF